MTLVIAFLGFGLTAMTRGFGRSIASTPANEPSVVATVEGKQIPANIYRMYLKNGIESLGLDDRTTTGRDKIDQLKAGIVSELIDRALIETEARRRDLAVSDDAFTEASGKVVAEMGGASKYQAYLSEHGLSDEEFRQTTRQELYSALLRDQLKKEVSIDGDEIREFYDNKRDDPAFANLFKQPERVRAAHILIGARPYQLASEIQATEKLSKTDLDRRVAREMAARRGRAESILESVRRGTDFDRLARQYSDDSGTRNRGGDLGLFTRGAHAAGFDEAAFALKPGQIGGLVETEYGYHIIKVSEHPAARLLTLDEVRPAIREQLLARKQAAHLQQWLEVRRREADIHVEPFFAKGQLQRSEKTAH